MTESKLFEIVSRAWRSLKGGEVKIAEGVEAYDFWPEHYFPYIDWRYIREPSEELVANIINYSDKKGIRPYFNMIESKRTEAIELAKKFGMKLDNSMSFAINLSPINSEGLPEYEYEIAPLDSHLYKEYSKITMDIFGFDDETLTEGNKNFFKKYPNENRVIIIRSNGKTVGTGCFCVNDEVAWLFGGGVYPEFQGKGFGKAILYILMQESLKLGAKAWFSQTQHSRVQAMAEYTVDLDTFSEPFD